jgi:hypothetical protein
MIMVAIFFFLEYARGLRIFVLRRKEFKVHEEEHKGRKTTGKAKTTRRKKPASGCNIF